MPPQQQQDCFILDPACQVWVYITPAAAEFHNNRFCWVSGWVCLGGAWITQQFLGFLSLLPLGCAVTIWVLPFWNLTSAYGLDRLWTYMDSGWVFPPACLGFCLPCCTLLLPAGCLLHCSASACFCCLLPLGSAAAWDSRCLLRSWVLPA